MNETDYVVDQIRLILDLLLVWRRVHHECHRQQKCPSMGQNAIMRWKNRMLNWSFFRWQHNVNERLFDKMLVKKMWLNPARMVLSMRAAHGEPQFMLCQNFSDACNRTCSFVSFRRIDILSDAWSDLIRHRFQNISQLTLEILNSDRVGFNCLPSSLFAGVKRFFSTACRPLKTGKIKVL